MFKIKTDESIHTIFAIQKKKKKKKVHFLQKHKFIIWHRITVLITNKVHLDDGNFFCNIPDGKDNANISVLVSVDQIVIRSLHRNWNGVIGHLIGAGCGVRRVHAKYGLADGFFGAMAHLLPSWKKWTQSLIVE